MNKDRRKLIEKAVGLLSDAKELIEQAAEEEQDYADNMPENLQGSERHENAEQAASELCDCAGELESVIDTLHEIVSV